MNSRATAISKPLPLLGKQRKSQSPSHTKLPSMAQSPCLIVRQGFWTVRSVAREVAYPYSGTPALAKYIKAHDLTKTRIAGVQEWIAAILPYFPRNIFSNFPNLDGLSFVDWRFRCHALDVGFAPDGCLGCACDVIVWPRCANNNSSVSWCRRNIGSILPPNWRFIGYFPGRIIFEGDFVWCHGYALFAAKKIADQFHLSRVPFEETDDVLVDEEMPPSPGQTNDETEDLAAAALAFGDLVRKIEPESAIWEYQTILHMLPDKPKKPAGSSNQEDTETTLKYTANVNLAVMLAGSRPQEAIEHSRAALRLAPDALAAYYVLGTLLSRTGQFEEAAEVYRAALRDRSQG